MARQSARFLLPHAAPPPVRSEKNANTRPEILEIAINFGVHEARDLGLPPRTLTNNSTHVSLLSDTELEELTSPSIQFQLSWSRHVIAAETHLHQRPQLGLTVAAHFFSEVQCRHQPRVVVVDHQLHVLREAVPRRANELLDVLSFLGDVVLEVTKYTPHPGHVSVKLGLKNLRGGVDSTAWWRLGSCVPHDCCVRFQTDVTIDKCRGHMEQGAAVQGLENADLWLQVSSFVIFEQK